MTPEQIQDLINYIKQIGEAAVSKGFELAVRQVGVQVGLSAFWTIIGILLLIVTIWLARHAIEAARNHQSWQYNSDMEIWGSMLAMCSGVGGFIMICVNVTTIISCALNPEWQAIKLILGLISG